MRIALEDRKKQYRIIYELLYETLRISVNTVTKIVGGARTATRRMKEAFEQQYSVGLELRKISCRNLREYIYVVNCKNHELAYPKYCEDTAIIYHTKIVKFCNLIVSREEIDGGR